MLRSRARQQAVSGLFAVVTAVLLIACANVANLLMSRAATRTREIAIRAAIGIGRGRIVRQLMTESALLAALGGVVELAIAFAGVPLLVKLNPVQLDASREIRIDYPVLAFTAVLSIATAFVFGVFPALFATRLDLHAASREGGMQATTGRRRQRLRSGLVISELALSNVLLVRIADPNVPQSGSYRRRHRSVQRNCGPDVARRQQIQHGRNGFAVV